MAEDVADIKETEEESSGVTIGVVPAEVLRGLVEGLAMTEWEEAVTMPEEGDTKRNSKNQLQVSLLKLFPIHWIAFCPKEAWCPEGLSRVLQFDRQQIFENF